MREAGLLAMLTKEQLINRVNRLEAALEPFANFADERRIMPPEMHITPGSYMAKRQLTMGDCYKAKEVLES